MIDPLDTMTLDQTAKRARDGELNSYALYAHEQGVDVIVPSNFHGQKRNASIFRLLAEESAAIIERREDYGLRFYEANKLAEIQEHLREHVEKLDTADMFTEDSEHLIELCSGAEADPYHARLSYWRANASNG